MARLGSQQLSRDQLADDVSWQRDLTVHGQTGETSITIQFTDVLSDGLDSRDITFDTTRGAFVTEWVNEQQWTDTEHIAVRIVSSVETEPIDIKLERDDTGNGDPDASSAWRSVTADNTPIEFDIYNGEAYYRVLLRYVRSSDFVRDIDIAYV